MHWHGFLLLLKAAALGFASTVASSPQAPRLVTGHGVDAATIERDQQRFEAETGVKAPCSMPRVSDGTKIVLLRASAEALSTVTIGSQDVATRTGAIVVDAGREPLYLIVVSHTPTVWSVAGAVERIERLVMAALFTGPNRGVPGETPLIGATGIARDRVTFLRHPHCLRLYEPSSTWIDTVDYLVKHELGRENVRRGDFGAVSEVSVPSFAYQSLRGSRRMPMVAYNRSNSALVVEGDPDSEIIISGRNDLDEELKIFTPGGVVQIDAEAVVASRQAEPYQVLPQQAGLLQLMQSGALSRDDAGDFIIERKIRLPAELNGGHKLRLRTGVPPPDGPAGFSCILSEETGTALSGSRC
jgi:hypothetical protein